MAWRFRRSIKIAPGLRLNLGKRGVSIRAGIKGAGITVGGSGKTVSAGLPGTGLYVSHKLKKARQKDEQSRASPDPSRASPLLVALFIVAAIWVYGHSQGGSDQIKYIILGALVLVIALAVVWLRTRRRRVRYATVNYLIPSKDAEPLAPKESFVAGVNRAGLCGEHRQGLIAKLRTGEPIYLVRQADNPHDPNAVILYSAEGKDIGFLPRETAMEIAPRLDKGSPVTATVSSVEPFETEKGQTLLGVRLRLVPHKLKKKLKSETPTKPPTEVEARRLEG